MRLSTRLLLASSLLLAPMAARATPFTLSVSLYNYPPGFDDGTILGTINIDTTLGQITSTNFNLTSSSLSLHFTSLPSAPVVYTGIYGPIYTVDFQDHDRWILLLSRSDTGRFACRLRGYRTQRHL